MVGDPQQAITIPPEAHTVEGDMVLPLLRAIEVEVDMPHPIDPGGSEDPPSSGGDPVVVVGGMGMVVGVMVGGSGVTDEGVVVSTTPCGNQEEGTSRIIITRPCSKTPGDFSSRGATRGKGNRKKIL